MKKDTRAQSRRGFAEKSRKGIEEEKDNAPDQVGVDADAENTEEALRRKREPG